MMANRDNKFKIGLVQMACSTSPDANLSKAIAGIREAAAQGAEIVCLQELFRSQYFCREENAQLFDLAEAIPGPSTEAIGSYRSRAAALGIGERVHWAGQQSVKSLGAYLRQADILVSPRLQGQNTPMKIYSYLDSGRPVLATRIPTHTQVLDDEIAQLVAPTPQAMAEGIVALLRDPSRRTSIADRAKARVTELYTPAAAQRKLREFYHRVQTVIGAGEPAA